MNHMTSCLSLLTGGSCPLPKLLEHGKISPLGQLYFCGTTVHFECDEGFILEGSESSSCLINDTWSRDFPSCKGALYFFLAL